MNEAIYEIKEVLAEMKELNVETTTTMTGLVYFIRALSAELRESNPALMDSVIARIEAKDTQMLDTKSQIHGKEFALALARSS